MITIREFDAPVITMYPSSDTENATRDGDDITEPITSEIKSDEMLLPEYPHRSKDIEA